MTLYVHIYWYVVCRSCYSLEGIRLKQIINTRMTRSEFFRILFFNWKNFSLASRSFIGIAHENTTTAIPIMFCRYKYCMPFGYRSWCYFCYCTFGSHSVGGKQQSYFIDFTQICVFTVKCANKSTKKKNLRDIPDLPNDCGLIYYC